MEFLVFLAVILGGTFLQSIVTMLLGARRRKAPQSVYDALTDARYSRIIRQ